VPELSLQSTVVVITLRGPRYYGGVLKDYSVTTLAGRSYLTGTAISREGHWAAGRRMHLACDEIATIVEFESEEAWRDGGYTRRQADAGLIRRLFGRT
jgi:hypothetical protein